MGNLANEEQTWQKCQAVDDFANPIARAKSRVKKARAPGDLQFLSFAKSICQFPWRWPTFMLCILFWEFTNSNKCQVNLPKPLEMLLLELEFRFKPKGTIHRGLTWAVQILKIKQITEVVNNPQDKIIKPN